MDLQLYLRVLWRFRILVAVGLLVAIALSFLSVVRVNLSGPGPHLAYKQKERWQSSASLLITETGFPWGRKPSDPDSDPTRLAELSNVYARLASSDAVRAIVERKERLDNRYEAIDAVAVPISPGSDYSLPVLTVTGTSFTAARAVMLAERTESAFRAYIARRQVASHIPRSQRVAVVELSQPDVGRALLVKGRSKTIPMVIFVTVMIAVSGLAFVLENLRPRVRPVAAEEAQAGSAAGAARRSA